MIKAKTYLTLSEAGELLRRFQLSEWALDRRMTKAAIKEQRTVVKLLLELICQREVSTEELDFVLNTMN